MVTLLRAGLVLVVLATGCSSAHLMEDDAGLAADVGSPPAADGSVDAAAAPRPDASAAPDAGVVLPDTGVVMPPPGVTTCGGASCADGEACCVLTLTCFDPSVPGTCMVPPDASDPAACASNADCAAGEICAVSDPAVSRQDAGPACGGTLGHCVLESPSTDCGGSGEGVCGCDGRTYPDRCAASRAGVRVSWNFPCGVSRPPADGDLCDSGAACPSGQHCDERVGLCAPDVPVVACGIDAQCPSGYACCGVVGLCMPSSCPECCFAPPAGSSFPCLSDADCDLLSYVRGSERGTFFCGIGEGCGTPGGCMRWDQTCGGELAPVCGCDGVSYANECWAGMAHTRVAHEGECP